MNLFVSETFYSIQGEGPTAGRPAVFLRLSGCNLLCGRKTDFGDLANGATWICDSIEVWQKGIKTPFAAVLSEQYLKELKRGVRLIITGGEPMLHQDVINDYLRWLFVAKRIRPTVEIETNGTIIPILGLRQKVSQWNVSPKLKNSGEPRQKRIVREALGVFARINHSKVIFKFVVLEEEDWAEIQEEFFDRDQLLTDPRRNQIWLMPACDNREKLLELNQTVVALAMREGVNFSTRLQIEIWNKTVGV